MQCLLGLLAFRNLINSFDQRLGTQFVDVYQKRLDSLEWLRKILFENVNNDFWFGHQVDQHEALNSMFDYLGLSSINVLFF